MPQKHGDVDAVLAANDELAGGVIRALKEAGIDEGICISGMDADPEACQRVIAGTQSMTVYKPIEAIAVKAAEIAMQIATEDNAPNMNLSVNNGFKQVPAVLLPAMVVCKETIDFNRYCRWLFAGTKYQAIKQKKAITLF
jgi:D-xylose transport system substrate-binding protein